MDGSSQFQSAGCGKGDIFLEMVMGSLQPLGLAFVYKFRPCDAFLRQRDLISTLGLGSGSFSEALICIHAFRLISSSVSHPLWPEHGGVAVDAGAVLTHSRS